MSGRLPWAALTMAGARYDNSAVGEGGAGIVGLAVPLGGEASLQLLGDPDVGNDAAAAGGRVSADVMLSLAARVVLP